MITNNVDKIRPLFTVRDFDSDKVLHSETLNF